jgi:hypothetical protein
MTKALVLILRLGLEGTLTALDPELIPDVRPLTKHDLYTAAYNLHLSYANGT